MYTRTLQMSILASFEQRLSVLETTMVPIHKKTQALTIAKTNIDATVKEIDSVFEHFKVSEEAYESIAERCD
jgi:hypothetical protein